MEPFVKLFEIYNFLLNDPIYILVLVFAGTVFLLGMLNIRVGRTLRTYQNLLQGTEKKNLEEILRDCIEHIDATEHKLESLEAFVEDIHKASQQYLSGVGIKRYNAFGDTGGNQSFALALLNNEGNGIVLSSLYGRAESKVFAKPVEGGVSKYSLSAEEKTVIRQALTGSE